MSKEIVLFGKTIFTIRTVEDELAIRRKEQYQKFDPNKVPPYDPANPNRKFTHEFVMRLYFRGIEISYKEYRPQIVEMHVVYDSEGKFRFTNFRDVLFPMSSEGFLVDGYCLSDYDGTIFIRDFFHRIYNYPGPGVSLTFDKGNLNVEFTFNLRQMPL